jgi:ABC-type lipoprotein export system ATPase subunit
MVMTETNSEQDNLTQLLAFRQQHTDNILSRYQIRPDLTIEELAQVVMYLSDCLKTEQQQRRSLESQLQELKHLVDQLKLNSLKTYGSGT